MTPVHDLLPALRAPAVDVTASLGPVSGAGAEVAVVGLRRDDAAASSSDSPRERVARALVGAGLADLSQQQRDDVAAVVVARRFDGSVGSVLELPWPVDTTAVVGDRSLMLLGLGSGETLELRRAAAAMARRLCGRDHAAVSWEGMDDLTAQAFLEGAVLGGFTYQISAGDQGPAPLSRLSLSGAEVAAEALTRGVQLARAGWYSRALAVTPSNIKSPDWLVNQAQDVAATHGLEIEVRGGDALRRDGFGGLLAVGQGSTYDPSLVQLTYTPPHASRRTPHVVLVGKGITFDTGGLSLKPAEAMAPMKRDMTGAGVVLAVLDSLSALGCPVRVSGLLAIAENSIGGGALRPGDVVRHYGGRTTEVTNTDAEGRLVLADAMAYAVDRLAPSVMVDVATLTGAVRIALGQRLGGLFTDDAELAEELGAAGQRSGERLWRLPIISDYEERIESKIADADNAGGSPGAITAALFLRHFAGDVRWAHLDLASVGDSPDDVHEWTQGATGFGSRLLLHWLCTGPAD